MSYRHLKNQKEDFTFPRLQSILQISAKNSGFLWCGPHAFILITIEDRFASNPISE